MSNYMPDLPDYSQEAYSSSSLSDPVQQVEPHPRPWLAPLVAFVAGNVALTVMIFSLFFFVALSGLGVKYTESNSKEVVKEKLADSPVKLGDKASSLGEKEKETEYKEIPSPEKDMSVARTPGKPVAVNDVSYITDLTSPSISATPSGNSLVTLKGYSLMGPSSFEMVTEEDVAGHNTIRCPLDGLNDMCVAGKMSTEKYGIAVSYSKDVNKELRVSGLPFSYASVDGSPMSSTVTVGDTSLAVVALPDGSGFVMAVVSKENQKSVTEVELRDVLRDFRVVSE